MTDLRRLQIIAQRKKQAEARDKWLAEHAPEAPGAPAEEADALEIPEPSDEDLAEIDEAGAVALEDGDPETDEPETDADVDGDEDSGDSDVPAPSMENTKAELVEFAEAAGIDVKPAWRKAEILDAILAAGSDADADGEG